MRHFGAYECRLLAGTRAYTAYTSKIESAVPVQTKASEVIISERHRHRYEFNNDYREQFEKQGLYFQA